MFFYKVKICGNPVYFVPPVSHFGNSHDISYFSITIVMVICDQSFLLLLLSLFGAIMNGTHTESKFRCCACSVCFTHQPFSVSPPLLGPSFSLRNNDTEMRPINNPIVASTCLSERKSHNSHLNFFFKSLPLMMYK